MSDDKSQWIKAKTKRAFYLPTTADDGKFDNSGKRVELTDELELLAKSNRIRINGVEFTMSTGCETIIKLIDKEGFIQFAKPAPPARFSTGGAHVGRLGSAVRAGGFDATNKEFPQDYQYEDPRNQGATHARGFPIVQEGGPRPVRKAHSQEGDFYGSGTTRSLNPTFDPNEPTRTPTHKPDGTKYTAEELEVIRELHAGLEEDHLGGNVEYREVKLSDGSMGKALFDKKTGLQVGTPIRMYQAQYDASGAQIGSRVESFGSGQARERAAAEYREALGNQQFELAANRHLAPDAAHQPLRPAAAPPRAPDPALDDPIVEPETPAIQLPVVSTGHPHLDGLIGGKPQLCLGVPLGDISYFIGDNTPLKTLIETSTKAASIEGAISKVVMAATKAKRTIVTVSLDEVLTDTLRLELAEALPALQSTLRGTNVAVVITSTDYGDNTPALLNYMTALVVHIAPHERETSFVTATVRRSTVSPTEGKTVSFPR